MISVTTTIQQPIAKLTAFRASSIGNAVAYEMEKSGAGSPPF